MRYRKLDADNDYVFGNGQLDFYRDVPAAVGLAVESGLLLWQGSWYLNTSLGVPYVAGVLGKNSQASADTTIKNQILSTQGVNNISSYTSTLNPIDRKLSIEVSINTIYGPTQINIANYRLY